MTEEIRSVVFADGWELAVDDCGVFITELTTGLYTFFAANGSVAYRAWRALFDSLYEEESLEGDYD